MVLKIYNTLTRKKEVFNPLDKTNVKMYCCGPTVYNFAHIGNLRTYIFEDFLRRVLAYNEYPVNHVMNVTDVGHLTDDADSGEDKMEKGARREGKTVQEIADFYTDAFFDDLAELNILSPTIIAKATEHIDDMVAMIKKLENNGYTYVSNGNVYYDITKFTYYCDLGKLNLDASKSTDRVEEDEGKKNKNDFVLWFTKSKFDEQSQKWDSPWGKGYPGWHIECSAMASKYLGEQIDIHCGGVDHIQVHHTNEIAQAEGAFGKHPWVRYWVHGEFLVFNEDKMSKSSGDFLTLKKLHEKGYAPTLYRFFCMSAHYRQQLNFNYAALDNAKNEFVKLKNKVVALKKELSLHKEKSIPADISFEKSDEYVSLQKKFLEAINDDLNIPKALGVLHEVLRSDLSSGEKLSLLYDFDSVFGLNISDWIEDNSKEVSEEELAKLHDLLYERSKARNAKDWKTADAIRDEILERGYVIKDTPDGQKVERK